MNWDAIGAIGEILGAIAVVATLIYLAKQLRQEARSDTAETMGSWLGDYNSLLLELIRDAEVSLIIRKGCTDFENLPANEQMRFHAWMVAHLLNAQVLYFQFDDGVMHQRIAEQIMSFNASLLKTKGGEQWWRTAQSIWREEFVERINELIEQTSPVNELWPWFYADKVEIDAPPNE